MEVSDNNDRKAYDAVPFGNPEYIKYEAVSALLVDVTQKFEYDAEFESNAYELEVAVLAYELEIDVVDNDDVNAAVTVPCTLLPLT